MKHAYLVKYGGAEVRCETPQAAADLIAELAKRTKIPPEVAWQRHEFSEFVEKIQLNQRRLLAALLKVPASLTDTEIRQRFGFGTNKVLAGWLSGISKVALSLGIDPQRIYTQRTNYRRRKPERRYSVTYGFRDQAKLADWPSESDLKEPIDLPGT
jgi:hypothetical protein